ncbi:MAG TPA: ABC transporter permease [Bacteroidota bacterium]|nr:ABC transporter permease [Bacteroidota bacterium]
MSVSWFIAKRYLAAQRHRGFLSFIAIFAILGVTLGTAALIITLTILDGFEHEIKEKVVEFTSHIEVEGYQNLPLQNYRHSMQEVMSKVPGVSSIRPFAGREGMIRSRSAIDGVFLKGIDPQQPLPLSQNRLVAGKFIDSVHHNIPLIVIGKKLAIRLNVQVGDKLVVFALPRAPAQSSQPRAMQFELSGIYESGMSEFDDVYAYTSLTDAQRLFQLDEAVTGYDIMVNNLDRVDEIAAAVQTVLGYPHYARTVFQTYRNLFSWVELQKELSPVLLSLIIVVATVNIIGTMLMFVLEKARAIAILKSLGAGPVLIRKIFTLQGLTIGGIGIILGNLLAFMLCWIQGTFKVLSLPSDIYYMSSVPILLNAQNFLLVTIIAFLLCLLTTFLPSRAAAKLQPVTIFRFG